MITEMIDIPSMEMIAVPIIQVDQVPELDLCPSTMTRATP